MLCCYNSYKIARILFKRCPYAFNKNVLFASTLTKPTPFENGVSPENHFLKKKFNDLVVWYEQLTGMDEVRLMQNRVIQAQDRFMAAQEKRRAMSKELTSIQNKLKEIYSELDTTTRGEERYLQLITQEHSILKEERRLSSEYALVEREERDSFAALSACVKESHEKERTQAERTKYWSIIGSIIGTVIGVAGSSINNEFKMRELRNLVKDLTLRDSMKSSDITAATILAHHEQELAAIVNEMKASVNSNTGDASQGNMLIEQLLHTIDSKHQAPSKIQDSVIALENKVEELKELLTSTKSSRYQDYIINENVDEGSDNIIQFKNIPPFLPNCETKVGKYNGQLVAIPNELESLIQRQTQETRLILIGVGVIGIVVPLLFSFLQR